MNTCIMLNKEMLLFDSIEKTVYVMFGKSCLKEIYLGFKLGKMKVLFMHLFRNF